MIEQERINEIDCQNFHIKMEPRKKKKDTKDLLFWQTAQSVDMSTDYSD